MRTVAGRNFRSHKLSRPSLRQSQPSSFCNKLSDVLPLMLNRCCVLLIAISQPTYEGHRPYTGEPYSRLLKMVRPAEASPPLPSLPLLLLPSPPSFPLPLEVGPLLRLRGLGERFSSPQKSGQSPAAERHHGGFQAKNLASSSKET